MSLALYRLSTSSIQGTVKNPPVTVAPQKPQLTDVDSEMAFLFNLCAGGQQAGVPDSAPLPDVMDWDSYFRFDN